MHFPISRLDLRLLQLTQSYCFLLCSSYRGKETREVVLYLNFVFCSSSMWYLLLKGLFTLKAFVFSRDYWWTLCWLFINSISPIHNNNQPRKGAWNHVTSNTRGSLSYILTELRWRGQNAQVSSVGGRMCQTAVQNSKLQNVWGCATWRFESTHMNFWDPSHGIQNRGPNHREAACALLTKCSGK